MKLFKVVLILSLLFIPFQAFAVDSHDICVSIKEHDTTLFSAIFAKLFCNEDEYSDVYLTEENDGQTVDIGIDNEIVIELEANHLTGYRWIHANPDGSFIYQIGESSYLPDPNCCCYPYTANCGGVETLTFGASQKGSGLIELVYASSLEGEPADEYKIYVEVH